MPRTGPRPVRSLPPQPAEKPQHFPATPRQFGHQRQFPPARPQQDRRHGGDEQRRVPEAADQPDYRTRQLNRCHDLPVAGRQFPTLDFRARNQLGASRGQGFKACTHVKTSGAGSLSPTPRGSPIAAWAGFLTCVPRAPRPRPRRQDTARQTLPAPPTGNPFPKRPPPQAGS